MNGKLKSHYGKHLPASGAQCSATFLSQIIEKSIVIVRSVSGVNPSRSPVLETEGRSISLPEQRLCLLPVRSALLRSASLKGEKVACVYLLSQVRNPTMTRGGGTTSRRERGGCACALQRFKIHQLNTVYT